MIFNNNSFLGSSLNRGFYESIGFDYNKDGTKGKFLGSLQSTLGMAFTAYNVYQGYKEDGITGAVGNFTTSTAQTMAFNVVTKGLGKLWNPYVIGAAVTLGTAHMFAQHGKNIKRNLQRSEFVTTPTNVINNAGALTARQRSIQALNDSRINARSALGNEANILHTRYRY
jgi:hypothetical protein